MIYRRPRERADARHSRLRGVWLRIGTVLVFAILSVLHLAAQGDEGELFAVRVVGGPNEVSALSALLQRDLHVEVRQGAVGARLGILLFSPPGQRSRAAFVATLRHWLAAHPQVLELPVSRHEHGHTVPTGRIIVEFAPDVSAASARAALTGLALTVVQEPSWFRPTRFVVEPRDMSNPGIPLTAIKALPNVRFAEADVLTISAAR